MCVWQQAASIQHPQSGEALAKLLANLWNWNKIAKRPWLVVGKNPNGKYRMKLESTKCFRIDSLLMNTAVLVRRAEGVLRYAAIGIAVSFLSGCCTPGIILTANQPENSLMNPTAVFQQTNSGRIALEGMQSKGPVYVILPKKDSLSGDIWANSTNSINEIKKMPREMTLRLEPKTGLPSGYGKIIDLPKNDVAMVIDETHPHRALYLLLPLALAVDIALLPVEVPFVIAFEKMGLAASQLPVVLSRRHPLEVVG